MPCKYTFTGENLHLSNLARLVKHFSMRPKKRELNNEDPSSKKEETHVQPSKKSKNIPAAQRLFVLRQTVMTARWRSAMSKTTFNQINTGSPLTEKC